MEVAAIIIFILVYLGMIFGSWPGLALDRTGIALLGAIAFIELRGISITQATSYINLSALSILFSFMIISAQFYFSGFYTRVIEGMEKWKLSPPELLFVVILISATLSAVLINDIVCLALTPLIIKVCFRKKLNAIPFLIALACSSNIGSALTLVGNPQNMLIGQVLDIPFTQYLKFSLIPCILGLMFTWIIVRYQIKDRWYEENQEIYPEIIPFDLWQSNKGIFVIGTLLFLFLFTDLPRDRISLVAAGFLLLSPRMASHSMLSFIDWQLLVLFIGLFIVTGSFLDMNKTKIFMQNVGNDLNFRSPFSIILIALVLANIVSNVPAAMLLISFIKTTFDGSVLALSSTLSGNLFIIGSIANIIVITQAAQYGIKIDWKKHLRVGLPLTVITLLITAGWIYLIS